MKIDFTFRAAVFSMLLIGWAGLTYAMVAANCSDGADPVEVKQLIEPVHRVPKCSQCGGPMSCPDCVAADFPPYISADWQ